MPRGSLPSDPRLLREILRLRHDPRLSAAMTAERLESWRTSLERDIGREVNAVDLYFIHLLGPAGGRRFLLELQRTPRCSAAEVMADAARTNRMIFAPHGRQLSLAEVHREIARSLVLAPEAVTALHPTGQMQVADAR